MIATCVVGAPWGYDVALHTGLDFTDQPLVWAPGGVRYVFCLNVTERVNVNFREGLEFVNFHCTPLPYGRGGHPIENMVLSGHAETVITAHRMTGEIDAGPIYCTRGPISLAGTKDDICDRFVEPVAQMMRWIIETNPEPTPQVGEPVYFKRLPPDVYAEFWAKRAHG